MPHQSAWSASLTTSHKRGQLLHHNRLFSFQSPHRRLQYLRSRAVELVDTVGVLGVEPSRSHGRPIYSRARNRAGLHTRSRRITLRRALLLRYRLTFMFALSLKFPRADDEDRTRSSALARPRATTTPHPQKVSEPPTGIEPVSLVYETSALPLCYRGTSRAADESNAADRFWRPT